MLASSLEECDIYLSRKTLGEHRTFCPRCQKIKFRQNDTALAVRIREDNIVWFCHRCLFKGAIGEPIQNPGQNPSQSVQKVQNGNSEIALAMWRSSQEITRGTCAYRYLVSERLIPPDTWNHDRLRWHPTCVWRDGKSPCLVAPVYSPDTLAVRGIWRVKIPRSKEKVERLGLGPSKGCAARLFQAGRSLVIAEGIEDALAASHLYRLPAWAGLSAGGVRAMVLPADIRTVYVVADHDRVGREAAQDLATRLRKEGREVKLRQSRTGKDANDALLGKTDA